ncbi:MAG TPA: serine hydrolase domain-containing protein [Blastocatellia bacterium]|nr:serine hydrolase domain-containing protein [Blastocatellia bacterium]
MTLCQTSGDELTEKVDKLFATWNRPDSPGCAIAIIKDGKIITARGYGIANLEHNVPITKTTVFYIASTSKQFTATSIALLAQRNKLALDDPIRKYLPELPELYQPVTLRHLIYHTSGIRDFQTLLDVQGRTDDVNTEQDVIELLARQKQLSFKPGEQFEYSNSGYFLLGVIVKRVSGQSLREFAAENIFSPLGMKNTHFHDDRSLVVNNRASGYIPRRNGGYSLYVTNFDLVGNGGLMTTVEDLFLWDQNFYQNKLDGGRDFITQLMTEGTLSNGEKTNYAYGLELGAYKGLRTTAHSGGFGGFVTEMLRFPEQRFTVICLSNERGTLDSTALAYQIADIYLAKEFKSQPPQTSSAPAPRPATTTDTLVSLTTTQMAEYAGDYYSDELQVTYRVRNERDKLFIRYRRVIDGELAPFSKDTFKIYGVIVIQFTRDGQNRISGFIPQNGGAKNIRFTKL